jgi:glycosyltransferase involved in cell wall biosynthesis
MRKPHISVIIPTYNNGKELQRALDSITSQRAFRLDPGTIEVLLINDQSDLPFRAQLEEINKNNAFVRLLHLSERSGPAAARNHGIRHAEGDLVGFLDADDAWPDDKLDILLPLLEDPLIEVAGGKIQYIVQEGARDVQMRYEDAANRITHVHLGALIARRALFDRDLYFDDSLTLSEDVDWWMRLREKQVGIVITEQTTLLYYVHEQNMSTHKGLDELGLLKIFHQSSKRRKNSLPFMPQLKDFRIDQPDPLISIVLPLYNGAHLIQKTIEHVLKQTYRHWELIVVDDGSSDGGAELIATHYPQVVLIKQANAGVAAARNKGVKAAKGDLLAFLDQDDEWLPNKLAAQWALLKKNPYCAFVTCNQQFFKQEGVVLPANFSEKLFEEHRSLVPSALLIRKQVLWNVRGFDETLEVSSDFDLIRRLRKSGYLEANVEQLLLKKWYHGNNASQDKEVLKKEILHLLFKQAKGQ